MFLMLFMASATLVEAGRDFCNMVGDKIANFKNCRDFRNAVRRTYRRDRKRLRMIY